MVQKDLERCAEQLRSAVHQLASGSGTPQEKLRGMVANTGFASIEEGDFPKGPLRRLSRNHLPDARRHWTTAIGNPHRNNVR